MSTAINGLGSNSYASMTYGLQSSTSAAQPDPAKLAASNLLSNLDGDDNGSLSQTELQTAVDELSSTRSGSEASTDALFAALDSDEDGAVTESEITTTLQTLAERQGFTPGAGGPGGPGGPPPPPPPSSSAESDSTTSTGTVSAADSDGDGEVSMEELLAYYQSQTENASASTATDTSASTTDSSSSTNSDNRLTTGVQSMIQRLAQTYGDPAQTHQPATADLSISA